MLELVAGVAVAIATMAFVLEPLVRRIGDAGPVAPEPELTPLEARPTQVLTKKPRVELPADDDLLDAEPEVVERPVITHAQRRRLFAIAREVGVHEEHLRSLILEQRGVESTAAMTVSDYDSLVELIQSRLPVNA